MDKNVLESFVKDGRTIASIAEETGKGKSTVRHWLNKYNLKTTGKAGGKVLNPEIDGMKRCTSCFEEKPVTDFRKRTDRPGTLQPFCMSCNTTSVLDKQRSIKQTCVNYKGGKCRDCDYGDHSHLGVFEFHHEEPEHKDFSVSDVKNRNFNSVLAELDKCVLLCANCHVKRHLAMKLEEGYNNKIEGNTERFRAVREQKLDYACDGDIKCSECGYDECSGALIISYRDEDKHFYKYNRKKENWSEEFKLALDNATIVCKNCHRSQW